MKKASTLSKGRGLLSFPSVWVFHLEGLDTHSILGYVGLTMGGVPGSMIG